VSDIVLTVREVDRRHGPYDVFVDGRYLLTSTQPFLDSARVLLEQGYDPGCRLVMRREGSDHDALAARLDAAAKLTVDESGPRLRPWKPHPGGAVDAFMRSLGGAVAPPMHSPEVAATPTPATELVCDAPSQPEAR
jgi:hypothetical protein